MCRAVANVDHPGTCRACGKSLPTQHGRGRTRIYCDASCRSAARRSRVKRVGVNKNLTELGAKGMLDEMSAAVLTTAELDTVRHGDLLAAALRLIDALTDPRGVGLDAVVAARELTLRSEDAVRDAVTHVRSAGATWQEIGDVLGTSRQAAFQRFGRPTDPRTGAPMAAPTVPHAPERAIALIVDILEGRWESARGQFGATLREALSADQIADTMAQVAGLVGAYGAMGEPFVHQAGTYTLVRVPLHFEAGDMTAHVTFDAQGEIAGVHIRKPDAI